MDSPEQEKAELCDEQWMRAHGGEGSITLDEVPELKSGVERVHHLMKDGEWHTAEEVRIAAGTDGVPAARVFVDCGIFARGTDSASRSAASKTLDSSSIALLQQVEVGKYYRTHGGYIAYVAVDERLLPFFTQTPEKPLLVYVDFGNGEWMQAWMTAEGLDEPDKVSEIDLDHVLPNAFHPF